MKGYISCFICGELHEYKKSDGVIAFACDFLGGIIHWDFYSKEDIEKHKKEAEPKTSWKNIFRKKGVEP